MATFPPANYISAPTRNEGEGKTAYEDWLAATKQIPGAGQIETTLTIIGDAVIPPSGVGGLFMLDTEAAGPTDDLKNISPVNFPDGSLIIFRPVSSTRTIQVIHSGGGAGQISLTSGGNVTLGNTRHWLCLKLTGTVWEEVWRIPAADTAPSVLVTAGSMVTTPSDRGRLIDVAAGAILTVGLLPAATAGKGFEQPIKNSGTSIITVDPAASELIDGSGAVDVHPGGSLIAVCDGAAWKTIARHHPVHAYFNSQGQLSKNNATFPNTRVDLLANALTLWDKGKRNTVVIENPSTVTIDKALDNATPNGRDQSAAFSNNSWVHAYWVWNAGIGLRGRLSVSAPPTGPAFVAGEDWWCYAGPWRIDASGNLRKSRIMGSSFSYDDSPTTTAILSGGTSTSMAAVSTASMVAPNATNIKCSWQKSAVLNAAGDNTLIITVFVISAINYLVLTHTQLGLGTSHTYTWTGYFELPNILQNFYYQWAVGAATAPSFSVWILGFDVANNG